jgi:hypothetical protein
MRWLKLPAAKHKEPVGNRPQMSSNQSSEKTPPERWLSRLKHYVILLGLIYVVGALENIILEKT